MVGKSKKLKKLIVGLVVLLVLGIYYWSIKGTEFSIKNFIEGLPFMADFFKRMFPPNINVVPLATKAAAETVQIAILGTTLAVFFAFPLGFLAAETMSNKPLIYGTFRVIANVFRGVSEIVWALLFVATVGLGPFPGVLALTVHSTGALTRFFADAIENIHEETISTMMSTGASRVQIIFQGIIPEVLPNFVSYILYYLEHNIRAATVLGIVGAGGIGFELLTSLKLFKYQEVLTIILTIVLLVTLVDRLSSLIRKRVIGWEGK